MSAPRRSRGSRGEVVNSRAISPGTGWYWFAAALFVVVGVLVPAAVFVPLFRSHTVAEMIVPGTTAVRLKVGNYVLWNDHTTIFQGTTYRSSSNLPAGVTVRLRAKMSGQEIAMKPDTMTTVSFGTAARNSIGGFSVNAPGAYLLEVSGLFAPRVFSLREAQLSQVLGRILLVVVLESTAWIGAPLIVIVVFLKRSRAKRGMG